jgi:hypothetical protein
MRGLRRARHRNQNASHGIHIDTAFSLLPSAWDHKAAAAYRSGKSKEVGLVSNPENRRQPDDSSVEAGVLHDFFGRKFRGAVSGRWPDPIGLIARFVRLAILPVVDGNGANLHKARNSKHLTHTCHLGSAIDVHTMQSFTGLPILNPYMG